MLPKKSQQEDAQQSLGIKLENFLNMDHELILLSKAIDWSSLETSTLAINSVF